MNNEDNLQITHDESKREFLRAELTRRIEERRNFEISQLQSSLWILEQTNSEEAVYNVPFAAKITGALNIQNFTRSISAVVERHELLRATIREEAAGLPTFNIGGSPVSVVVEDRRDTGEDEIEQELKIWFHKPFVLDAEILVKFRLIQLEDETFIFAVLAHHITIDGWSMNILLRDISTAYRNISLDVEPALPPKPRRYQDYIKQQNIGGERTKLPQLLDYWRNQYNILPKKIEFGSERSGIVPTKIAHVSTYVLDASLVRLVLEVAPRLQVTPYILYLTAFGYALSNHYMIDDFTIGIFSNGRDNDNFEDTIGMFVNTLPLRFKVDHNQPQYSFQRIRDTVLDTFDHASIPYSIIVKEISPPRVYNKDPLIQFAFDLHSDSLGSLKLSELLISSATSILNRSKFDLSLTIIEGPSEVKGFVEYLPSEFNVHDIDKLMDEFKIQIIKLVESSHELASPILKQPNIDEEFCLDALAPEVISLYQRVQTWAKQTPNAVAIVDGEQRISYKDLYQTINTLANVLYSSSHSSMEDNLIGIFLPRSYKSIAALLAILKIGAAYVPLDPDLPYERLQFILKDSNIKILVTNTDGITVFSNSNLVINNIDDLNSQSLGDIVIPVDLASNQLAYVIYTSGSTGQPKGVQVEHRSIDSQTENWINTYNLDSNDVHLQMANLSFDVFTGDLCRALGSGGRLVICDRTTLLDMEALFRLIEKERVSVAEFVPAVLIPLTDYMVDSGFEFRNIKLIISGSDKITNGDLARLSNILNQDARIVNSYGVTEATIDSLYYNFPRNRVDSAMTITPIGKPFPNTRVYAMNADGRLSKKGESGELLIGGSGVARGYLNRPSLTDEKFIFHEQIGERVYATGDWAVQTPDDQWQFIERIDYQVKIRGYRIEVEEIEAVLKRHLHVTQAIVLSCQPKERGVILIAYIQIKEGSTINYDELTSFISVSLPNYMRPSQYITIKQFPVTFNGKIDRKALLAASEIHLKTDLFPIYGEVEEKLALLFITVLKIQSVTANDEFFSIGGDSLTAVQVIFHAKKIDLKVNLRDLYGNYSIRELAQIVKARSRNDLSVIKTLNRKKETSIVPLVASQKAFLTKNFSERNESFIGINIIEFKYSIDHSRLMRAVQSLVAHHDSFHMRFELKEDWIQVRGTGIINPDNLIDARVRHNQSQTEYWSNIQVISQQLTNSIDIFKGDLLAAAHITDHSSRSTLVLALHHLAMDAMSWDILMTDLDTLIDGIGDGKQVLLPEGTSFETWAHAVNDYANSDEMESELKHFWLNLPWDRVKPIYNIIDRDNRSWIKCVEQTMDLTVIESEASIRNMLLASAAHAITSNFETDVMSAMWTSNGRYPLSDDLDPSRTVGWLNIGYPVVVSSGKGFAENALDEVAQFMSQVPNRGIGFQAAYYLSSRRSTVELLRNLPPRHVAVHYEANLYREQSYRSIDKIHNLPIKKYNWPAVVGMKLMSSHDGEKLSSNWAYDRRGFTNDQIQSVIATQNLFIARHLRRKKS